MKSGSAEMTDPVVLSKAAKTSGKASSVAPGRCSRKRDTAGSGLTDSIDASAKWSASRSAAGGTRWVSPGFGLLWALLLWATLLPHAYFKSGIIDPLFNYEILLSIFFGVGACTDALQGRSPAGKGLAAGLASGFAVLTKGPVGFLLWGMVS